MSGTKVLLGTIATGLVIAPEPLSTGTGLVILALLGFSYLAGGK